MSNLLLALLVVAVALAASARVVEVWQLVLVFGLLSGIGTGLVASVLGAAVASRWFVRHRGLVVGIFGAASSAGQLVFYPLLALLVEGSGWRGAALVVAGCSLALVIPALLVFRRQPEDIGLLPDGDTEASARALAATPAATGARRPRLAMTEHQWTRAEAMRTKELWFLIGIFGNSREDGPSEFDRYFIMVGIMGGYTTFSTFSLQTLALAQDGEWLEAGLNVILSLVLCLLGVWLGHAVAVSLNR